MKPRNLFIGLVFLLAVLAACDTTTREARRMVKRAERLADTLPDSTLRLIDSVLHLPVYFSERERMDMAMLQGEVLFGDHGQEIPPVMDDDFFDDRGNLYTSPELERAAAYYAKKKDYAKAAHAALYSGFVQQHYDEKEAAMRSFKEAERYGLLATDSLTVAQAEYWMGKKFIDDGVEQEAMNLLMSSASYIGNRYVDLATIENSKAVAYIVMGQNDSAELCLRQSLMYVEKGYSDKVKRKVWNNFAVLYRIQGKYENALDCLCRMLDDSNLNENGIFMSNLNLAQVFFDMKEMDSATKYFQCLETILPTVNVKKETMATAYDALSRFAAYQDDTSLALQYREKHERVLCDLLMQRQEQTIYRTQRQYDYESLQNEMNRKLIKQKRIIFVVGVLAFIGLAVFAISQIRLARIRKQEAAAKDKLFHFMQQNKELSIKQENSERALVHLSLEHEASNKAYQDLMQRSMELESDRDDFAQQYSLSLDKIALIIRKLSIYWDNKGEAACLADLKEAAFGKNTPWDALMEVFDILYPDVRRNLALQHPELTELEQEDFILCNL